MNAFERTPVSVIVPVRNEELNIEKCLRSLEWADEVFVVDSQSEDQTVEIASRLGASVVQFNYDGSWPKKKNWAIRNLPLRNEWILILDADERVGSGLANEISEAVKDATVNGYYVRWKFVFMGRWMRHCWSHGWMLRLFRWGSGEYEDLGMRAEGDWDNEVHENIIVQGKVGRLSSWLIHESEQSLSFWLEKQNRFSDWNAVYRHKNGSFGLPRISDLFTRDPLRRRRALKNIFVRLPLKPVLLFFYLYILRGGFLDGREGYYFCALRASHELNINAKIFERKKGLQKL